MSADRTVPVTVLTPQVPVVLNGRPTVPTYWARYDSTGTLVQGAGHIRAIADPNPIWNPATSGWFTPPPPSSASSSGDFDARWSVNDLPDPGGFGGSYYWLGDPTSQDGTGGMQSGGRQWSPDPSTSGAPAWRSFFPYKPSVRAFDSYLPGGSIVHHPKGVHFNPHYIEHMWCDFGGDRRQPFTWVIAGMVVNYPATNYTHHFLDAGRDPDAVGFPRLSANACNIPRLIQDGLGYRSLLEVGPALATMTAGGAVARMRVDASIRPKMYFSVFNGAHSLLGVYQPGARRVQSAVMDNTSSQHHRFFVLGRKQGAISQSLASHILLFEVRYWHAALTKDDLAGQYHQLSSTYQFDRYRAI